MVDPTYRAVVCEALGAPESLQLQPLARQVLSPGAVRVRIKAAGINFPDLLTIQGLYQHRPQLPFVPGVEAAGIVVETAADVHGLSLGQRVIARMRTGGYAEEAVVPASQVVPMPQGFTFAEAATFLVAHGTAYHALVSRGGLVPGQTLLVLGAAGGVGLAVLTLAAQGLVRPLVSARFPLPEWAAAMRLLKSRKAIGRVALEMDGA